MTFLVNPFAFGGGAPSGADVVIAVQEFDCRTTTGTLDVTTTDLGGKTPKFALLVLTRHLASNDPGESANESVCISFATPTESVVAYSSSDDNFTTTRTVRGTSTNDVLIRQNYGNTGGTIRIAASVSAWITNGVTLNFTIADGGACRGAIAFFAGDDFSADLTRLNLGTGTSALTVGGLSVEPDLVLALGISNSADITSINPSGIHFGVALPDGTQKSIWRKEANLAADGSPELYISSNRICADKDGATVNYTVTASNFTSNSFDVTPSASAGNDRMHFAVLNFGGKAVSLSDFTTPTSTGAQTISTSFTPQFALSVLTSLEARDTASATDDLQGGFGIGLIGSNEQWAASFRTDSGAATTDTASDMKSGALRGASATSTAEIVAALTSFSGAGVNLNYSAVAANAKMGFMLAIEE